MDLVKFIEQLEKITGNIQLSRAQHSALLTGLSNLKKFVQEHSKGNQDESNSELPE